MNKFLQQTALFTGVLFFGLSCSDYDSDVCIKFYRHEVFTPKRLGNVEIYKDISGFHIVNDGEIYDVQNCFCDPILRNMSNDQLMNFLGRTPRMIVLTPEEFDQINLGYAIELTGNAKTLFINQLMGVGYIAVNQMQNGEYILRAKTRLPGGNEESILKEGTLMAAKISAYGLGATAIGGAITAGTAQAAAIAAAEAAIAAGGPAATAIAAALTGGTGVGGAAISGALGSVIVAAPIMVISFPAVIVIGVGYVYIKRWWKKEIPSQANAQPSSNKDAENTGTHLEQESGAIEEAAWE